MQLIVLSVFNNQFLKKCLILVPELVEEGVRTTVETLDKQLKEVESYAALFTSML